MVSNVLHGPCSSIHWRKCSTRFCRLGCRGPIVACIWNKMLPGIATEITFWLPFPVTAPVHSGQLGVQMHQFPSGIIRWVLQFYVAGASAAAAAGVLPWTSAARFPLLAVFGGALTAERCLPPRLHRLLSAGDEGQVRLSSRSSAPLTDACSIFEALHLHFQCPYTSCLRSKHIK